MASTPAALSYPLTTEPDLEGSGIVEIVPGVRWMRLPLKAPLNFINVWMLDESDGFTLVDTGIFSDATVSAWTHALAVPLADRPLRRIVVTHMHADHCGMAGWLQERSGAPLWMSRLEYLSCRVMTADSAGAAPAAAIEFYRAAGWDDAALERYRQRFGLFGRLVSPLPRSFQRLSDRERILLGGSSWQVLVGRGHSPEHVCLYNEALGLLISGDQVLPRISSNVSVQPLEPDRDPLQDWLTSLRALKACVPDSVLVLPAHNSPFHGLHARIDALVNGHERNLAALRANLTQERRAVDVFHLLFRRAIVPEVLSMATGEAIAHLNYLLHQGLAQRRTDAHGVHWYRAS